MRQKSPLSVAVIVLANIVAAALIDSVSAGSKHTLYLATCTLRRSLTTPTIWSAIAYYANGPPTAALSATPTTLTTIGTGLAVWEGNTTLGTFSSTINAGADYLTNGQIAGSAKLGSEDFACFRDGTTVVAGGTQGLGLQTWSCTADYYCPSITV